MTRHETLGMNRIFENIAANDVTINVVIHDRNMAVNKIVQQHSVDNQNAFWHGIKSVKKLSHKFLCNHNINMAPCGTKSKMIKWIL